MITQDLIRSLLWEEETSSLDFKRDQYPFVGATDDQKSELLKDLLAFANAFRRSDAYILVGVKEVKGWQSEIIGISTDIDDSQFQQFVNGKTNRILEFSYRAMDLDGEKIGIFHIPLQQRPVFLKKDYGKLKKNEVYYRLGTSTMTASPDVIAAMGTSSVKAQPVYEPLLSVTFEDRSNSLDVQIPEFTRFTEDDVLQRVEAFKKQYPLAIYRAAVIQENDYSSSNSLRNMLRQATPKVPLPEEVEVAEYNAYLSNCYFEYEKYTRAMFEYRDQVMGQLSVRILVKNHGTLPADDVDIHLHFPDSIEVLTSYSQAEEPKEPDAPWSLENYKFNLVITGSSTSDRRISYPDRNQSERIQQTSSGFKLHELTTSGLVGNISRLKHGFEKCIGILIIRLDSANLVPLFRIECKLRAANVPHAVVSALTVNMTTVP